MNLSVSPKLRNKLSTSPGLCQQLPAHEEEWTATEAGIHRGRIQHLSELGIIERVQDTGGESTTSVWRTVAHIDAWIEKHNLRDPDKSPRYIQSGDASIRCPGCGCRSFRNEHDRDGLTCKRCDATAPKSVWCGGEYGE